MTRFACVDDQKAAGFPVTTACTAAGVSTSGFYDWSARKDADPTAAKAAEVELVALMRKIHARSDSAFGVPRMSSPCARPGMSSTSSGWPA